MRDSNAIMREIQSTFLNPESSKEMKVLTCDQMISELTFKREELVRSVIESMVNEGMEPTDAEYLVNELQAKKEVNKNLEYISIINRSLLLHPEHSLEYSDKIVMINDNIRMVRTAMIEIRESLYDVFTEEIAIAFLPAPRLIREYTIFGKKYYLTGKTTGQSIKDVYNRVTDLEVRIRKDIGESLNFSMVCAGGFFGEEIRKKVRKSTTEECPSLQFSELILYNDSMCFLYNYVALGICFSNLIYTRGKGVYIATVVKEMEGILGTINWAEFVTTGNIKDNFAGVSLQYSPATHWADFVRINSLD